MKWEASTGSNPEFIQMSDGNPTQLCLHIHLESCGSKPLDFVVHVGFHSPFPLHLLCFWELWEQFGLEPTSLFFARLYPLRTPVCTLSHKCPETQFNTVTRWWMCASTTPAQLQWWLIVHGFALHPCSLFYSLLHTHTHTTNPVPV